MQDGLIVVYATTSLAIGPAIDLGVLRGVDLVYLQKQFVETHDPLPPISKRPRAKALPIERRQRPFQPQSSYG